MNTLRDKDEVPVNHNDLWLLIIDTCDEIALAILVRKMQGVFMSFLMKQGASIEDAEDVIQEAWGKAWCKRSQFDRKYTFISWMLTIVKNVYRDHVRIKKRRLQPVHGANFDFVPGVSDEFYEPWYIGIEDQLRTDAAEISIIVQDTIVSLTRDNVSVLLYLVRDRMTTDEIASRMKKDSQTIRWHLNECRRKILLRCTRRDFEVELF